MARSRPWGSVEADVQLTSETILRLLVVEDDPDLNHQLTALTDAGYVVDRAFDGEEGHYLGDSEPTTRSYSTSACRVWTASRYWRHGAATDARCRC